MHQLQNSPGRTAEYNSVISDLTLKDDFEKVQQSRKDLLAELERIKRDCNNANSDKESLKRKFDEASYGEKEARERLSTLEKRYLNLQRETASYQERSQKLESDLAQQSSLENKLAKGDYMSYCQS